jgi:membrane protein
VRIVGVARAIAVTQQSTPHPVRKHPQALDSVSAVAVGILIGLAAVFVQLRPRPAGGVGHADGHRHTEAARSPVEISAVGWRRILLRTWREFVDDRIPAVAAGATFYGLLALFPAIGAFVSLYGLFSNVEDARQQVVRLAGVLPEGGVSVLSDQMILLAKTPHVGLGVTFLMGLLISIWSANAGVKAIISGLNIAYEEREERNFVRLNLVSLGFTFSAILFALIAAAAVAVAPATLAKLGLGDLHGASLLRWPTLLIVALGVLAMLYRYGPSRAHARWRWVTPGSAIAAVAWLIMSGGYSVYVANFGSFNKTYGSLGAVIGFMIWIWLSLMVTLLGAELNSEIEQQTTVDTTTGRPRPKGARGAAVTDGARGAS